ncbi:MAG: peptide deformylase [Clostridiales bacterium]|nr:peptide deformylase [Clostridiales bacterium]
MATRKIVEIGDNKLRKQCKIVDKFDKRLNILLKDMAETMYKANGVGLAAPQVGILKRAVVIDVGDGLIELVNPVIIAREGEQSGPEGCLSIPGRSGIVVRPNAVTVHAQNAQGDDIEVLGEEFFARAICHELDHLDGVMYVDIMEREIFPEEEEDDDEYDDDDEFEEEDE